MSAMNGPRTLEDVIKGFGTKEFLVLLRFPSRYFSSIFDGLLEDKKLDPHIVWTFVSGMGSCL